MRVDFIRNFNATEDLVRNETFFCSKHHKPSAFGAKTNGTTQIAEPGTMINVVVRGIKKTNDISRKHPHHSSRRQE